MKACSCVGDAFTLRTFGVEFYLFEEIMRLATAFPAKYSNPCRANFPPTTIPTLNNLELKIRFLSSCGISGAIQPTVSAKSPIVEKFFHLRLLGGRALHARGNQGHQVPVLMMGHRDHLKTTMTVMTMKCWG